MLKIQPKAKQVTALNLLRENWNRHRTLLLSASVGFGKTAIAAFIADGMVSRGLRVMFVAPYTVLLDQTATRFVEYGLPADEISFVWRNHPIHDPDKLIQIASADTLIRRKFPKNIDLMIVDEAHIRRKALLEVIRDTGIKVIGLSGTPYANWMGKYYEKLVKPTTMKELIEIGDLSGYEFFAPDKPDVSRVKTSNSGTWGNDYNECQLAEIMGGAELVGNIVKFWLENGEDRATVCFCVNVKHANHVTTEFIRAGVNAEVMTADTPHEDRQLIINRFESGATRVIVNVGVLVAGFDSDVRCIVYARPTKSEIRWTQCLGRGLRTAKGKDKCLIFDHSGTVHRLGFPDDIEYDELQTKTDGMKQQYDSEPPEKIEKQPKECSQCHYMKPAGMYICPKCGFKPLVGEDVDTDESRGLKKLTGKQRVYSQNEKQHWWSQIKYYQRERLTTGKPISDGWCAHTYKQKFGTWPRNVHDTLIQITPEVSNFIRSKQIAWAKGQQKITKQTNRSKELKEVRSEDGRSSQGAMA